MKKTLLDTMVDRFLGWKLPATFYPDGGITFEAAVDATSPHWPVGTNLLTADQAKQMLEHVVGDFSKLGKPYRHRDGRYCQLVGVHPDDGACLIVEQIDREDCDVGHFFMCERSELTPAVGMIPCPRCGYKIPVMPSDDGLARVCASCSAPQQGRFGDKDLLDQVKALCAAIENLPAGYHHSVMSMRAGELAFGLRRLQTVGDYVWPTQLVEVVLNRPDGKFVRGDRVRKTKGSQWRGRVVGFYSTELTPEGYAVESSTEKGSVQIYPAAALELDTEV